MVWIVVEDCLNSDFFSPFRYFINFYVAFKSTKFTLQYSVTCIKRSPIKRPPSIKQPLCKVPIYLSVICCTWYLYSTATSIKRPQPPFCCCKSIINFIWVFIFIKRSENYLSMWNGEISWARFFSRINCWCKKVRETCQRYLAFFLYIISSKRLTVHFNYVPSVLELELCMGLKCTWCFVTMNFEFIFIYVHFFKAFCYKE